MSYGFNDPFSSAPPPVQIQRVGGWKLLAGAMLAAGGLGFAGFVYLGPYKKTATALHERTTELGKERGASDDLSSERDRLKAEAAKRQAAAQEKAGGDAKRRETLQGLAAELKVALAAVGATISVDDSRIGVSLSVPSLFDQPMSVAISPQGETTLRVVVTGLKKTGMRGKVKAKLIPSAPPRELAQFKNIGEFEMLRAARIMLALAADGVPADHLAVAGELAGPASRKTKGGVPDRLDIEIEPE